jgi:nitrilase
MSKVAAIQMASSPNVDSNLIEAARLIKLAAESEAKLVVLPENFALMGMSEQDKVKIREQEGEGQIQKFLSEQAKRNHVWLVGGTIPMTCNDPNKILAACLVYNDQGEQVARYNKIHLFDVEIEESGETYNESETIENGNDIVVVDTPVGKLGLAVCYDLRFPELFRAMINKGAEIFSLPSAFTAITGKAHWDILVRARAVENLAYVIAAAQGGYHANGRHTYGHSMIVDPWGNVLNQLNTGSGVVIAEVKQEQVAKTRQTFPALSHRRVACELL